MKKLFTLAMFFVFASGLLYIHRDSYATDSRVKDEFAKGFISPIGKVAAIDEEFKRRIASTLKKLGKNLILENTRGTKEISAYQKVAPAVVFVLTETGFGSGAIIDGRGQVITNWHVIEGYSDVVVVFKPKDSTELKKELAFRTKVIKIDREADLALLKINSPPQNISTIQLGTSKTPAIGQDVHAIGHPQGEIWTYTKGIISQIRPNYEWVSEKGIKHKAGVIQTQTPISPGSSGGPLFDDEGYLLGLNSFQRGSGSINYAVAIDEIQKFLRKKTSLKKITKKPSFEPKCVEHYDTTGAGWPNIYGCLVYRKKIPPDLWMVFRENNEPPVYFGTASKKRERIDTVTVSKENKWKILYHLMDTDCDGNVDLIGIQKAGDEEINQYKKPFKDIYLPSVAKEMDYALKRKIIPYPMLRLCQ